MNPARHGESTQAKTAQTGTAAKPLGAAPSPGVATPMSIREVSRLVSGMCFLCMQATTRAKTGHPRKSLSYLFRHDSVVMAGGKGWCVVEVRLVELGSKHMQSSSVQSCGTNGPHSPIQSNPLVNQQPSQHRQSHRQRQQQRHHHQITSGVFCDAYPRLVIGCDAHRAKTRCATDSTAGQVPAPYTLSRALI